MEEAEVTYGWHFGRSFLKMAAMLSMLCDHIAFVLIPAADYPELYYIMRAIGRIAFPIFCFMLVEGFIYTSSREKYMLRLLVFAVVSEIPFDLASKGPAFDWGSQNVMWTLLIGFIVMYLMEWKENNYLAKVIIIFAGGVLAYFMRTDYSVFGVFIIAVMYLFRYNRRNQMIFMGLLVATQGRIETFALLSIPFILNYNPDKNNVKLPKYFFYAFYPVHMFILYLIYYFHRIF